MDVEMKMERSTKKRCGYYGKKILMNCYSTIYGHMKRMSPDQSRYRGFALAYVVIVVFVLFLFVGYTIDMGNIFLVTHQMHNAADAAALAGAPYANKHPDMARDLAQEFGYYHKADGVNVSLERNDENLPYGDIITGRYTYNPVDDKSYFFCYDPDAEDPVTVNALAVNVSRTQDHHGAIPFRFGPLVGVNEANREGFCEIYYWDPDSETYEILPNPDTGLPPTKFGPFAVAISAGGTGAGLICLRPDNIGLDIQGGSTLIVNNDLAEDPTDGAININSSWDIGLSLTGTGGDSITVEAYALNLWGDAYDPPDYEFPPEDVEFINYRSPPIPDPLFYLQPPSDWTEVTIPGIVEPGKITKITEGDDITLPPGYYSGGWNMNGGKLTLQSGIYILDAPAKGGDSGLVITGGLLDASFETTGGGVMFYIAGNGVLDISGTSTIWADPMTEETYSDPTSEDDSDNFQHIMFFQARDNIQTATIIGNGDSLITGTMYFPQKVDPDPGNPETQNYALELGGTGLGFGNQVIADSISIRGNSEVLINYDGRNPAPETRAFLVE